MLPSKYYLEMKDSGTPLFGMIPSHWKLCKFQQVFSQRKELNPGDKELLSVYLDRGVIKYSDSTGLQVHKPSDSLDKYQCVYVGDFVLNNQQAWRGSVGISRFEGIISPAYLVYRLSPDALPEYMSYLVRDASMVQQYEIASRGVGTIQRNIFEPWLKKSVVVLPPMEEQMAIAEYLDEETKIIDAIITEAKASVEEYKAWKASIIFEAVTKGLDPNVELKDSGVPWLGDIPCDWSACALKRLTTKIGSGKTPSGGAEVYATKGIMFLRSQNVYNTGLELDNVSYISEEIDAEMSNTRVQFHDVLLNITGGSIGRCCLYDLADVPANVNQHVCILRADSSKLLPQYLRYFWNSAAGPMVVAQHQTGGNRQGLNFEQIGTTKIPYCSIEEQHKIVDFLDIRCGEIDSLVAEKEKLISDLESYKKSLIFEVVTGKRKVV